MTSGFLQAVHWFRQRGWRWLLRRLRDEWVSPRSRRVRNVRRQLLSMSGASTPAAPRPSGAGAIARRDARTLHFFFDLQLCPVAYDIATYLAGAEIERRRLGLDAVHVVIVPGHVDGMRLELPAYDAVIDADARRWRLHNVVVPVLGLLPSCTGYTVCSTRAQAGLLFSECARHVFPAGWEPALPVAPVARVVRDAARAGTQVFPLLRAGAAALRYAAQFIASLPPARELLVITLRQYDYTPGRNSNLDAWARFADRVDAARFVVAFVLDAEVSLDPTPESIRRHRVIHAASWNVQFRMALYERAFLNLSVVHGPMELCWYNEACRYLLFCPVDTAPLTARDFLEKEGFDIGRPLPFARSGQRWIWERDDLEVIEREFAGILDVLDAAGRTS